MDLNKTASQSKPVTDKSRENLTAQDSGNISPPVEKPKKGSFNLSNKSILLVLGLFIIAGLTLAVFQLSKLPQMLPFITETPYGECQSDADCPSGYYCTPENICELNPQPPTCNSCASFGMTDSDICPGGSVDCSWCCKDGAGINYCCWSDNCVCSSGSQKQCTGSNGCITILGAGGPTTATICDCTSNPTCPCSSNCRTITIPAWGSEGYSNCFFGPGECGQVDVHGYCGSCKDTGCVPVNSPSPSPRPSPSPSPSPAQSCTTLGTFTVTDNGNSTINVNVTDDLAYQNVEIRVTRKDTTVATYNNSTTCGNSCWNWTNLPEDYTNITKVEFYVNVTVSGQNGEFCGVWNAPQIQCTSLDYYQFNGATPTVGQNPVYGDNVSFVCQSQSSPTDYVADYFEFQYQIDGVQTYQSITAGAPQCNTGTGVCTSVSDTINIVSDGYYIVQCRVCKNTDVCTPWGQTGI